MNARQKAKMYKRMYESLLEAKPHIIFHEKPCTIDTLNVSMILPKQFALLGDDYIRKIVIDGLVKELAKCPEKYIDGYTEYLPYDASPRLHYQIKILRKPPKLEAEIITRGNCMMCGKELTEGLFFCKECREKSESEEKE